MDVDFIVRQFQDSARIKDKFAQTYAEQILVVGQLLVQTFQAGRKVLLFGNGGSATDASHIASEFVGRYKRERPPLPALALTTDMAALTCIANDYDYTEIFSRQLTAHGQQGDVVIAMSTSGNSMNVLHGVQEAKKQELVIVGWTGGMGGKLASLVDHPFIVPSSSTARIQECHMTLGHVLCEFVEERLFAKAT
jgi:D-sedoheptulose 7-phosphate isomerase